MREFCNSKAIHIGEWPSNFNVLVEEVILKSGVCDSCCESKEVTNTPNFTNEAYIEHGVQWRTWM